METLSYKLEAYIKSTLDEKDIINYIKDHLDTLFLEIDNIKITKEESLKTENA